MPPTLFALLPAIGLVVALVASGCGPHTAPSVASPAVQVAASTSNAASHACDRPRLIVQITVDQLRFDLLARYAARFGDDGLGRLWEGGVRYVNAHYRHAITETAPGHATLATGADPAVHGIVANHWFDPESGKPVYNTFDADSPLVGVAAEPAEGRSPRALRVSTFADELWLASGGEARSYAVSIKDRGAVLLAGRKGHAFWYDNRSGRFITSRHFASELPAWVEQFNDSEPWAPYAGQAWTLSRPASEYVHARADDRPYEHGVAGWGATFPHAYGRPEDETFFARLSFSPAGDELASAFVHALFDAEELGSRPGETDFLSVSFSSTDYVGHFWGPSSLESEDNLLRLDRTVAGLLALIDERVGLDRALVVLSADHGAAEAPEQRAALGLRAGRAHMQGFDVGAVHEGAGAPGDEPLDLLHNVQFPYVWLDAGKVVRAGLDWPEARRRVAEAFAAQSGVHAAFTRELLQGTDSTADPVLRRARRSYDPARSGDVHVVAEPYFLLSLSPGPASLTASHGSPWSYDTHVPILAIGPGLAPQVVARPVGPHAIAPTLAMRAGAATPSGAVGEVLGELVQCAPR